MSPEYRQILEDAEELQAEFKRQPCHLERLYGTLLFKCVNIFCAILYTLSFTRQLANFYEKLSAVIQIATLHFQSDNLNLFADYKLYKC